jgi:hypothetical protein
MAVVVIALDRRLFDGPVHPLDLPIRPRRVDFGDTVLDAVFAAAHIEHVGHEGWPWDVGVARREAELDAVVGENGVDLVGHCRGKGCEKGRGGDPGCLLDQLDEGELAGPVPAPPSPSTARAAPRPAPYIRTTNRLPVPPPHTARHPNLTAGNQGARDPSPGPQAVNSQGAPPHTTNGPDPATSADGAAEEDGPAASPS